MPKFKINFTERNHGSVTVQAATQEEAMQKWEEVVFEGNADYANTDLQFKTVEKEG